MTAPVRILAGARTVDLKPAAYAYGSPPGAPAPDGPIDDDAPDVAELAAELASLSDDEIGALASALGVDAEKLRAALSSPADGGDPTNAPAAPPTTEGPKTMQNARTKTAAEINAERTEAAARDLLLANHGHLLVPRIRRWASTAPYPAVKALLAKVQADGGGAVRGDARGLQGAERAALAQTMGTQRATASPMPHRNEKGELVLPSTPPSEVRRIMAAEAARGRR